MKQQTISDVEYSARKRKTKREEFLEIMDEIIPWEEWVEYIKPYYPSGKRGRPPKGIEKMLRMYLLQCWFNLSDEGVEDAIYDSYAMRKFVGIDFFEEDAPDATTLLKFRRLLEKNNLNKAFFEAINRVMVESGHIMRGRTIVDCRRMQIGCMRCSSVPISTCWHVQDGLSKNLRLPDKGNHALLGLFGIGFRGFDPEKAPRRVPLCTDLSIVMDYP